MQDSTQVLKLHVKSHVQNLTNLTQISSDFEFDSDENSEISYTIAPPKESSEKYSSTCICPFSSMFSK